MTIASSESLQVIYKAASYNFQEVHNLLKFSAKYEFLKSIKIQCGKVLYNSSTGENQWSNIVEDEEMRPDKWKTLYSVFSDRIIELLEYSEIYFTLTEPLLTHSFQNVKIFLHKITNPIIPTEIVILSVILILILIHVKTFSKLKNNIIFPPFNIKGGGERGRRNLVSRRHVKEIQPKET